MTVEVPEYGGCVWPVDPACLTENWDAFNDEVKNRALALASSTLARLTGYRVGNCSITVRPCTRRSAFNSVPLYVLQSGFGPFFPHLGIDGRWINCSPCDSLGCTVTCEVALPAPVGRVEQVKVDGDVMDPATYRVDNGNLLVYTGTDDCPWPANQDLSLPDTEPGTFSVTYLNAYPVDSLGAYAAGILAMEYAKACTGSASKCRLPSGVTSIVRAGITMEISSAAFPNGMTGIREVDTFIALWNPRGLSRAATVWSPDVPTARITTGGSS